LLYLIVLIDAERVGTPKADQMPEIALQPQNHTLSGWRSLAPACPASKQFPGPLGHFSGEGGYSRIPEDPSLQTHSSVFLLPWPLQGASLLRSVAAGCWRVLRDKNQR
jgi:hypothetical protein